MKNYNRIIACCAAILTSLFCLAVSNAQQTANDAPKPKPQLTTTPIQCGGHHTRFMQRVKQGNIDLLFFGDSITSGWDKEVWAKNYGSLNAANFGIGGERVESVTWAILNGEVDGITPKVIVVMIGTNNLNRDSTEDIVDGITLVVKKLRERTPKSKVLLLGILPRNLTPPNKSVPIRDKIKQVNAAVTKLDDGKKVRFLDLGEKFLNRDGTISREIMPDLLHLSKKGYEIWADGMRPLLTEMMK